MEICYWYREVLREMHQNIIAMLATINIKIILQKVLVVQLQLNNIWIISDEHQPPKQAYLFVARKACMYMYVYVIIFIKFAVG